ncbi:DUF7282 domain-containing protein [Halococcus qingdaonensis]|uniref:DUF7282 domain-containing protein n=1 Tax=Halococcus qingdaonensis TaxID=224402 RepID=UPI00211720DD|nr:hypothetical protein [Halococcus qingdaonensis]
MFERHSRVVLVAVVCLSIGIVSLPALDPVGDVDATIGDARQFQQNGTGVATGSQNDSVASNVSVMLDNQTTTGTTARIRSVTLPEPGFVTIHNRSYRSTGNESGTSIVGVSSFLDAGKHENVTVVFRRLLEANQTLTAVVHRDSNGNGNFDYASANGFVDTAFGVNGTPVSDSGVATIQRLPRSGVGNAFDDRPTSPSVTIENQTAINDRITVDSVRLPIYSWIVVHNSSYDVSSPSTATIIGRTKRVRIGTFRNITIELYDVPGRNFDRYRPNESERLYVSLYRDTNRNGEFDFRNLSHGTDTPYLNESGVPLVTRVRVNNTGTPGNETAVASPERPPTTAMLEPTSASGVGRRATTDRSGGEAGASGDDSGAGSGSGGLVGLFAIGSIVAVLVIGWVAAGRSRTSDDSDVSALQQELARIRMAVSRHGVDMRAYGIPVEWRTLEIDLSADDSAERRSAVEALAAIDGLDLAAMDGETPDDADREFVHRSMTISLPRETVERAEDAAAEGDKRSQEVIATLRRVLSAYYPDAVRATSDTYGDA